MFSSLRGSCRSFLVPILALAVKVSAVVVFVRASSASSAPGADSCNATKLNAFETTTIFFTPLTAPCPSVNETAYFEFAFRVPYVPGQHFSATQLSIAVSFESRSISHNNSTVDDFFLIRTFSRQPTNWDECSLRLKPNKTDGQVNNSLCSEHLHQPDKLCIGATFSAPSNSSQAHYVAVTRALTTTASCDPNERITVEVHLMDFIANADSTGSTCTHPIVQRCVDSLVKSPSSTIPTVPLDSDPSASPHMLATDPATSSPSSTKAIPEEDIETPNRGVSSGARIKRRKVIGLSVWLIVCWSLVWQIVVI